MRVKLKVKEKGAEPRGLHKEQHGGVAKGLIPPAATAERALHDAMCFTITSELDAQASPRQREEKHLWKAHSVM